MWAIASVVYDSLGRKDKADEYIAQIAKVLKRRPLTRQVDFDRGLAGLLYTVEFVEGYYGREIFSRADVLMVC